VQSLAFTDPVGDLGVSIGQSVHRADPFNALYFPATHDVQLKFGPDEPALQVQVVKAPLTSSVHSSSFPARPTNLWGGGTTGCVLESVYVSKQSFFI
jgi:hypothetical protein